MRKQQDIKPGDRVTITATVESAGHDDQHVIVRIGSNPVQIPIPDGNAINLAVPSRIHAKLAEIAGFSSVQDWARSVILRAAEEASPNLKRSGLWRSDVSAWAAADRDMRGPLGRQRGGGE